MSTSAQTPPRVLDRAIQFGRQRFGAKRPRSAVDAQAIVCASAADLGHS
jgi:hypothetical protein